MKNLMLPAQLPEMETEEEKILHEVIQILSYISGSPTINRQTLAADVMGVAAKCLKTMNNDKLKISSLEKELNYMREEWKNGSERASHDEDDLIDVKQSDPHPANVHDSQADQLQRNTLIGATIVSSSAEYEVESILGSGVSGIVAKCWKKSSKELVALKIIKDRSHIQVAKQEAEILEYLNASGSEDFNIVTCIDSFMFDGHFCLEFKLLDTSLLNIISEYKFLELNQIRPILQQAAVALRFLKNAGVVHTDLKPDNIMLVDYYQQPLKIQIIDFGLAICDPGKLTAQGFQALLYRSPEVLLGAPFNYAIDVWSLGCIAAEMLMGAPLFHASDETELMRLIVSLMGQPPEELLDSGVYTRKFFDERTSGEQPPGWTLKSPGDSRPQISSAGAAEDVPRKLLELVKAPTSLQTDEYQAFEWDRLFFIDLLQMMLHLDPVQRITPEEILAHPFITLLHLDPQIHCSYVKTSIQDMDAYNRQFVDGGEIAQGPSSRSSSTSTHEIGMLIIENPENSDEEPSVQDVFIRGANGSPHERHLEDLDLSESVNSKHMVVCNSCTSDGEEHVEQRSASTIGFTSNHLANEHCSSDLSSAEQTSTQDVLFRKEKRHNEMHLEDFDISESVGRLPQQNEEETQSMTCDCSSPPKEKTQSNSNTNTRRRRKNLRRRQQRKAKKKPTKTCQ